ncbi:MAG: XTP/dITP diphosphatase [Bacillota bacterium]
MKPLVLATRNKGKLAEFRDLLKDYPVHIMSLGDFPDIPEIEETGVSFAENALIKAGTVAKATGLLAVADDSGLEVDCLDGAPGVHSARFAGEPKNEQRNNEKLVTLLRDVPKERRRARFRCVLAVVTSEGQEFLAEGACEGVINLEPRGSHGFGYDPLFFLPEFGQTMAELDPEIKNRISHRARAFQAVKKVLVKLI